ncbi:MAG: ABC transporter permease subunit [Syntrophomonadaceae bacterium]|nr:ABC transporter permease subunit [Syntrophomonadaceae bacterium]
MLRSVYWKTLRDQRRALFWWSIGLLGIALSLTFFYPFIGKSPELNRLFEEAPPAIKVLIGEAANFTSPTGYLNTKLFFLFLPLLFLVFTINQGSSSIAGEEEAGTLDLLLANPLARWRLVLEKFGALLAATVLVGLIFWLGLAFGARTVGMEISIYRMAEAVFSAALLGLAFGSLALALGCATGRRGTSAGTTTAIALAAYLINSLAPLVERLEPFRRLSLFYYYIGADPLVKGLNIQHVAVLIGLTVVFLAVSVLSFEYRDLTV